MVKVKEDMTGWVMSEHGVPDSRLTVIHQVEDKIKPNGVHEAMWLCECSCEEHKQVIVRGYAVKNGITKSCGCLQKESARKTREDSHTTNIYDYSREYGVGYCHNTGTEFYFDWEDYDKIKDYCWSESVDNNKNYHWLCAWDKEKKKVVKMHHIVVGKYYDHIDRNPLNNRKNNLRPSTFSENTTNRKLFKNNTSQITGVHMDKYGKWIAYLNTSGERIYLGYFTNKDDAIKARLDAEVKYHNEFAPQKHLYEQYNINIGDEHNDK